MKKDLHDFLSDPSHSVALAAFVNALPLDDGHLERSKKLFNQYYEQEKKNAASNNR